MSAQNKEKEKEKKKDPLIISNWSSSILFDVAKYTVNRSGTNKPEMRQKLVHEELQKHFPSIVRPEQKLTKEVLIALDVHSPDYIEFLEKCHQTWLQQETPDTQYLDAEFNGLKPLNFPAQKSFLNANLLAKLPIWKRIGFYAEDTMTPIYANTFALALESANNCYVACDYLKDHDLIYCLNTMPCHHSTRSTYGGYCFINSVAICAKMLSEQIREQNELGEAQRKKVAVLDVDYHAGCLNTFFENNPNVLTISIHADPLFDYPSFYGFVEENTERSHNIIFPKKATWKEYSSCVREALKKIAAFGADVLIVSFGGDTFKGDPDASENYGCALELDDYFKMGHMIHELYGKKIIVASQGGYALDEMPTITLNFLNGLRGK